MTLPVTFRPNYPELQARQAATNVDAALVCEVCGARYPTNAAYSMTMRWGTCGQDGGSCTLEPGLQIARPGGYRS